jgi:hypothetical protein
LYGKLWTGWNGSEYEPVMGSCEYGNEPSGSIKGGKFPHYPASYPMGTGGSFPDDKAAGA